jgi:hypothetical protein
LEIEREQQRPIDLSAADDQGKLETRLRREWRRLRAPPAISLDATTRDTQGQEVPGLFKTLRAPTESDPLLAMLFESAEWDEESAEADLLALRDRTYSEFAAYLAFLQKIDMNVGAAAAYLALSRRSFLLRLRRSHDRVRVQPSPFDRIVSIERDFYPKPGVLRPVKVVNAAGASQLPLQFA